MECPFRFRLNDNLFVDSLSTIAFPVRFFLLYVKNNMSYHCCHYYIIHFPCSVRMLCRLSYFSHPFCLWIEISKATTKKHHTCWRYKCQVSNPPARRRLLSHVCFFSSRRRSFTIISLSLSLSRFFEKAIVMLHNDCMMRCDAIRLDLPIDLEWLQGSGFLNLHCCSHSFIRSSL